MSDNAVMPLSDYTNACDKIREKTGSTDLIKSGELPEKINIVFEAGKQAEYDAFWDAYQQNGNRTSYVEGFCRLGWRDETYNPKYDIIAENYGLQSTFSNASNLTDTRVNLIVNGDGLQATFNMCTRLERIPSLILGVPITKVANTFYLCKALRELNITCAGEGCISGNGLNLQWSTNLTIESLRSIINALEDKSADTSGTVWTVTVGSENYAKLTEEDLQKIYEKGWQFI